MQEEELRRGDQIGPLDWHKILPLEPDTASDRLGWVGLEALRCRKVLAFDLSPRAVVYHLLTGRPPFSGAGGMAVLVAHARDTAWFPAML